MNISASQRGSVTVLALEGRLDTTGAPELQGRVEQLIASGDRAVVLDFAAVKFVSSEGLRAILVSSKRAAAAGGAVLVAAPSPLVREVFDIAGFARILDIHLTMDAAVERAGARTGAVRP